MNLYLFHNLHVVRLYCAIENAVAKCDILLSADASHMGKNKVERRLDIFRIVDYDDWIVETRPPSCAFLATP